MVAWHERRLRKAKKGIYSVTPLGVKRPLSTLVVFHLLDDGEEPGRLFVEDWTDGWKLD